MIRVTHTYVTMELSPEAYDEIAQKMNDAGYDQAFHLENKGDQYATIDMHGIAVKREPEPDPALAMEVIATEGDF